jgi:hypothetical protein
MIWFLDPIRRSAPRKILHHHINFIQNTSKKVGAVLKKEEVSRIN